MATTAQWIAGTRPRTLPAAVVPVAVGAAVAYFLHSPLGGFAFGFRTVLALIVSLALQVGVNYANDYSDGIRGTDEVRVGPVRLVGQQLAEPREVKLAALASFAVAGLAGLVVVLLTGAWWLLLVGALAIVAAWFYTGGPRPYGYAGLGELFVFVFFGLVAVAGTTFVLTGRIEFLAIVMAVPIGLFACALLIINNLRDIPGDTAGGKRTLAVRIGDQQTRNLYGGAIGLPFAIAVVVGFAGIAFASMFPAGALIAVIAMPFAVAPWKTVRSGALGPALIPALAATGRLQLAYGLLLTVGIIASR
ncbi:MAG: 1,4-dihydroxy-2-naphthoate polyprenyltransferase [Candidatus Nanopelagicales bacterium]